MGPIITLQAIALIVTHAAALATQVGVIGVLMTPTVEGALRLPIPVVENPLCPLPVKPPPAINGHV